MQVSISKAAKMVGIKSRSTFYRHIEKKGISVIDGTDGKPRIDVSELIRVYGDKVKMPNNDTPKTEQNTTKTKQSIQDNTPQETPKKTGQGGKVTEDIAVLAERIKGMEELRSFYERERQQEKQLLSDQIETLKQALDQSQEQQKRLTHLLTDQREDKGSEKSEADKRLEKLETLVEDLNKENRRLLEIEQKRTERIKERKEAQERLEKQEREAAQARASRGIFSKLFG